MDDQRKRERDADDRPTRERTSGGTGAPAALGQGGPAGNPSGPRDANDPGSTRYGKRRGTGSNEPKHSERKETADWTSRQGGDQSTGPGTEPNHDAKESDR
jgi:hypothetical protein